MTASAREEEARTLVPAIFEPLAHELLRVADLHSHDSLLDLACGSGIVARVAEQQGLVAPGRSVGVDPNASRVSLAARLAPPGSRRAWLRAKAEALPAANASFSLVVCQHGMMFFSDLAEGWREVYRVLRPGGRLVTSGWGPVARNPGFDCLARTFGARIGPDAARAVRVPFAQPHGVDTARGLRGIGFDPTEVHSLNLEIRYPSVRDFVETFAGSTSLAPFVRAAGRSVLESIVGDAERELAGRVTPEGLTVPGDAYAVVAVRPGASL